MNALFLECAFIFLNWISIHYDKRKCDSIIDTLIFPDSNGFVAQIGTKLWTWWKRRLSIFYCHWVSDWICSQREWQYLAQVVSNLQNSKSVNSLFRDSPRRRKRLCLWCHRSSPPHQRMTKYSGGLKVCGNPAENSRANGTCPLMSGLFVSQKHSTYQSTVCKWHNPLLYVKNVVRCNLLKQKTFPLYDDLLSGIHWSTCLQCRGLYSFKHWLPFKKHWMQLESTNNECVCVKRVNTEKKESVRKHSGLYIFPRNALFKPSPGGSDNYKVEYKMKTEKDALRQENTEGLWVKSL